MFDTYHTANRRDLYSLESKKIFPFFSIFSKTSMLLSVYFEASALEEKDFFSVMDSPCGDL